MDSRSHVVYRIDGDDRLAGVNAAWTEFAEANGGDALRPARVIGRVLWDFLADSTTVHLYRVMCARVRDGLGPVR
ncbi:MAG TPA: hypothetical protein VFZ24_03835, partial [Longimicrobiales bacterium]